MLLEELYCTISCVCSLHFTITLAKGRTPNGLECADIQSKAWSKGDIEMCRVFGPGASHSAAVLCFAFSVVDATLSKFVNL